MLVHLIYIDESGDGTTGIFSALSIRADCWMMSFQRIKAFRQRLRESDGIDVQREFHAWKFISGRGALGNKFVSVQRRCQIFRETLTLLAGLPSAALFNAVFPIKRETWGLERLLNRIQRYMQAENSHAVIVCDAGKEDHYNMLRRRMAVHNYVPSRFGAWDTGSSTKNIVIDRVIEDMFFKDSKQSYLVQMADFCAYALLRREKPIPSKDALGLSAAFALLSPILMKKANASDPEGIIRI